MGDININQKSIMEPRMALNLISSCLILPVQELKGTSPLNNNSGAYDKNSHCRVSVGGVGFLTAEILLFSSGKEGPWCLSVTMINTLWQIPEYMHMSSKVAHLLLG